MNSDHDKLLELLPAYAIGALEGEELESVEEHLEAGCARCESELMELSRAVEAVAGTAGRVEPAETTWNRIQRELGRSRGSSSTAAAAAPRAWGRWVAAAAVVLAAFGALFWLHLGVRDALEQQRAERQAVEARLVEVQRELATVREELAYVRALNRIVGAPGTFGVRLAGLEEAPGASGHTYMNPESGQAALYATGLPPTPPRKDYQLWLIADGLPVSAGVFEVDEEGRGTLIVDQIQAAPESIQAWAVTLEPAGGVPQPTGPMVLKG